MATMSLTESRARLLGPGGFFSLGLFLPELHRKNGLIWFDTGLAKRHADMQHSKESCH